MKKTKCPYCNANLTVPENYLGTDVTCPSCGQSFFCDADAPDADPGANRAPFVRPQPPASRPSRAPFPQQRRPAPKTPLYQILDAYLLLPILLLIVSSVISWIWNPIVGASFFLLSLVFVIVGHLGAIATRLKTIEAILRDRNP